MRSPVPLYLVLGLRIARRTDRLLEGLDVTSSRVPAVVREDRLAVRPTALGHEACGVLGPIRRKGAAERPGRDSFGSVLPENRVRPRPVPMRLVRLAPGGEVPDSRGLDGRPPLGSGFLSPERIRHPPRLA